MKNKVQHIISGIALILVLSYTANAQTTAQKIGKNPTTIAPSAVLDIDSENKGVLFPRVALTSTTDGTAPIAAPATGLVVYNTATAGTAPNNVTPGYYFWNGTQWARFSAGDQASKWTNDAANTNVYLTNLSNGFTARTGATNFAITDNNVLQIGDMTNVASPAWPERGIIARKTGNASITSISDGGIYSVFENQIYGGSVAGSAAYNVFAKSRGSLASPVAVQNSDIIGIFDFRGWSGTGFGNSARLITRVDGAVTSTSVPVSFEFHTVGPGETSPSQRLKISSNGYIGVSNSSPTSLFANTDTQIIGSNAQSSSSATGFSWRNTNAGWAGAFYSSGAFNGLNVKTTGTTAATTVFEAGTGTNSQTDNAGAGGSSPILKVQGNSVVGINNTAPTATLDVISASGASNSINADAQMLRLSRNITTSQKWDNIAQFNLGSYNNTTLSSFSRLDLALKDGTGVGSPLTNVMTWQANGNVGIGTTAPSRFLDVINNSSTYNGIIEAEGPVSNTYTRAMAIRMRRGTSTAPTAIQTNDVSALGFAGYDGSTYSTAAAGISGLASENWTSTAKGMALTLSTSLNGTSNDIKERMRIDHNGNVGIGTTTPTTTLHVQSPLPGTATVNTNAQVLRLSRIGTPSVKWDNIAQFNLGSFSANTAADTKLDLVLNNTNLTLSSTPVMTWNANGNVGVNTTAPSAPLVVQGVTGNGVLKLIAPSVSAGDNWWMGFGHGTTSTDANDRARIGVDIAGGGAGRLFFTTGAPASQTRAMFIDESQRVGIGTNNPTSRLEVNGAATNTVAFNAAAGTTIDFSKSNLAYTTANPGNTFTLSNIKDGGTYTLAVQGTTAGTASFTASGFTFKTPNNGLTAGGKETIYTFMVMGTKVYFYMTTGL